ncbi:hypothetical protein SAMN02799631_00777 [Methylobacterium sp. 174MFSha1.1]|nr:hypothetical protein SAMN02799631_00777 [Methylobacterium sp. 174MFSha1.1]
MSVPIIIMSFDRPEYLERFCVSLREQVGFDLDENLIHLMQDGGRSRRTGCVYANEEALDASAAVFKRHFPHSHLHRAEENLGIAMNFERAEKFAFQNLGADVAYFFEDDMELGPYYLHILDRMRAAGQDCPNLGYFACYGDIYRGFDAKHAKIVPLEHHWGFGLTRRCWEAMQGWIAPFYEIYRHTDYKFRPHLTILRQFLTKDVAWGETSQDVIKTAACASLGFARINTDVCFARYIGVQGQSFNEQTFKELGYDRAPLIVEKPDSLEAITEPLLAQFAVGKRRAMAEFRVRELDARIADWSRRMFEPDRMASREDIDGLWKLIMDRLPGEDFYERNVGKRSVRGIRSELLRSAEGRGKSFYFG